jgi:hypothetical protein
MKLKQIVYWGVYIVISLIGLYLGLRESFDINLLTVLLGWIIVFRFYEIVQGEIIFQRYASHSLRIILLTWPQVLTHLGLIILLGFNLKFINFHMGVFGLGLIIILSSFYSQTVHLYSLTEQGLLDINKNRLISRQNIKDIQVKDQMMYVEQADEKDTLLIELGRDNLEKGLQFKKLIENNYGV